MTRYYRADGRSLLLPQPSRCPPRSFAASSRVKFIRFLNVIDAKVPKTKAVHIIVDTYATHKHPKVLEWIENHPRFVFHFTPTSTSWLNAVESFFAKLTKKRLKRGVFRSLQELKDAIHRFLDHTNAKPKPFTWTKDPNKIIAAVKRGHQMLDSTSSCISPNRPRFLA